MGTKAGVMPLHVWLPRAHPIAPAPVSALMSGVMIKVALYGLVRVLVEWVGVLPVWFGVLVLAVGALSAVGGVVYALFQHDLKRLLALHSIENVGIIVLGLGACLILRARGADAWAAFALGAALLHTVNHAVFKALLFLGAGAFERAVGSLELDRLGGLLRRMPWTAGAFLVGAMAIAGLPPLNGFASEWLTLQALLHVTAYGHVGDGIAGAVALAALAATAALALFCFVKVVGLVLLGPPRSEAAAAAEEAPLPMRAALVLPRRRLRRARRRPRRALRPARRARALVGRRADRDRARASGHRLAADGLDRGRARWRSPAGWRSCAGADAAAPAPTWACGQRLEPALRWTSAGFTKPLRLVLELRAAPAAGDHGAERGRRPAGGLVFRPRAPPDRRSPLRAARACVARRRRPGPAAAERQPRHVRRLPRRPRPRAPRRRASGVARMSGATAVAGAVQIVGGIALAPLLPGLVQHWKARLQGRRGPSPLQPYRELRRLWGKSAVAPEGATVVYRLAPSVVAAAIAAAVLVVPVAATAPSWGVGHDALLLVGLLALARFAVVAAAWDVGSGFSLIGASRDLTLSVFVEATLVLSLAVAALVAGTTDLRGVVAATAGTRGLDEPGAGARRARLRARRRRRDGPAAGRQPRHAPRADDDPRGATARVRRPRPRLPAVGRGRPPLARARARRAGLPAPSARTCGSSSPSCPSCSSCSAPRSRSSRRSSRRCASCSCRGCSPPARSRHCSGSPPGS